MTDDTAARHRETGEGWDVVARAKYRGELDGHVRHLRGGGHNLLDEEVREIGGLIQGAHVVQLQCSHGLDALGLLNAGAASVLGVDISAEMIDQARAKADAVGASSATFLVSDVTRLPEDLDGTADLVYTGRGSLPWILDLPAWAASVRRLLAPGGHVFVFEGHPLTALWRTDTAGLELRPGASYFHDRPVANEGFPGGLVRRAVGEDGPRMLERFWRPGEVVNALVDQGLRIVRLREHAALFWDQFPAWPDELGRRLPNSYSILAGR